MAYAEGAHHETRLQLAEQRRQQFEQRTDGHMPPLLRGLTPEQGDLRTRQRHLNVSPMPIDAGDRTIGPGTDEFPIERLELVDPPHVRRAAVSQPRIFFEERLEPPVPVSTPKRRHYLVGADTTFDQ